MKNLVFVFDLDKTIGYFSLAIVMESIEDYIKSFINEIDSLGITCY